MRSMPSPAFLYPCGVCGGMITLISACTGMDSLATVMIASPEKALFDVFYLSGTKPRTFSSLPEVELPDDFDFEKLRNWTRKVPSQRLRTIVERRTAELESASESA